MSEKLTEVLGTVLQLKPEEITEKIKTEDGLKELSEQAKNLKVFKTNQDYLNELNVYKSNYKTILSQDIYKENKTNIHAALEKEIKAGIPELEALEYKKDYHSTSELIKKKLQLELEKSGKKQNVEEWEKEKNSMLKTIEENKKRADTIETETKSKFLQRIHKREVDHAIDLIAPTIDVEEDKLDAQKKYLSFLFAESGVTMEENAEGVTILRQNGNILVDDLHKPISLNKFVNDLAAKNLQIKSNVPAGGRGGSPNSSNQNAHIDLLQFKTWNEYLQHRKESGKPLVVGSKEANELYGKFMKAQK